MRSKLLILGIYLIFAFKSFAGDIATESTQWANGGIMFLIQQISAVIRDAQTAIRDIEEIQSEVLDGQILTQIPGIEPIIDLLNQVEGVISEGRALAHTSAQLEDKMKERFKSYEKYLEDLAAGVARLPDGTVIHNADGQAVDGLSREAYVERFKVWSATHDETVRNILRAHGLQAGQFDTEKDRIETLQNLSRSSVGRMQALQVGNEIANETLLQLQKLREIIMEQSSLHASYFAKKRAMEAEEQARSSITLKRLMPLDGNDGVMLGF